MTARGWMTIAAGAAAAVVAAVLAGSGVLDGIDAGVSDRLDRGPGVSPRLLVVGVDDRFDADELARLLTTLEGAGAVAIGWSDLVVPSERDPAELAALASAVAGTGSLAVRMDAAPLVRGADDGGSVRPRWVDPWVPGSPPAVHALIARPPDGAAVRTVPLTVRLSSGERFVALPAALAAAATVAADERRDALEQARFVDDGLAIGDLLVPDQDGALRIRYSGVLVRDVPGTTTAAIPDAVPYAGARQVLDGATAVVRGRVVLVGTVDFRDARYLPVPGGPSSGLPEVWVLANALNTVLTGAYAVPVAPWQNLAAMVVLAGVGAAAVRRGPVWSGAAFLVGATGLLLVVAAQRIRAGDLVAVAAPVAALVLGAAGSFAVRWVTDTRHRRHVHRLFASYVPAAVARELMADPARALRAADGQRADITVFFCDLRGFTATAATLEPSQVRELLQVYYRHTAQHVLDQGGTVMQYVGDEVFAVFGAPLPQDDHAERAVAAAQRAQAANEAIDAELAAQGLPGVGYGIGLQSGPVVAAHVGELGQRRQYTVVGDTVNVGARLCSQAGRGEIVVSEDVLARMSHPPAGQPMGSVPLKGVERQLELVRLSSS